MFLVTQSPYYVFFIAMFYYLIDIRGMLPTVYLSIDNILDILFIIRVVTVSYYYNDMIL